MDNPFPTETTPLANPQGDDEEGQQYQRRQDSLPSDTESNGSTGQSQLLWDELDAPWPSTFERSISLLASPGVARADVKAFTMSPKPGSTPLALQRRRTLGRGFYTPDASSALFVQQRTRRQGRAADDEDTEEAAWPSTRQNRSDRSHKKDGGAMTKMQSLDFGVQVVASTQAQLATKAQQAKEYRAQFLNASKLANSERDDDHLRSPGYAREVQSLRQKQLAQQQKVDSHSVPAGSSKSTVLQSAFNLANILMGVGLLGLPFGFRVAGFGGAMICLTVFGGICWRTSILIGRELNGDYRPSSYFDDNPFKSPHPPGSPHGRLLAPITSFPDIARRAFGETGNLILSCLLYFELFSCICIFFVSIGDHLHSLFPAVGIKALTCLVAAISLVPSILLKTPTLLSYFSMVGTLATIVVVLTVVATAVMQGSVVEEMQEIQEAAGVTSSLAPYTAFDSSGLVLCLGLVAYCFSGHAIVPSIYSSMKEPQRFEEMVTWTFVVVMATCFAVAVSGYYMFGSTVADQVTLSLESYFQAGGMMDILIWLMILTAFSKVTLTMFPLALGMEEILAPYYATESAVEVTSVVIKIGLTVLAVLVSIYVPSFSFLCALTGMVCTMTVSVIFPAAAHWKMFWNHIPWWEHALDAGFVVVGLFMAIVGTIATLD